MFVLRNKSIADVWTMLDDSFKTYKSKSLEQNGLDDEPQVLVDEALSKEYEKQPEELASIGKPNQ